MPCPACGYEHGVGAWPCPQCGRVPDASRWSLGITLATPPGHIAQDGADVTPALSAEAGPSEAAARALGLDDGQPHISPGSTEPARASAAAAATPSAAPHPTLTESRAVARKQSLSHELPLRLSTAYFLSGVGLGLVPLLIVSLTMAVSLRLSAPSPASGILAGYAVAGATWMASIVAMIVLITRRRLRFIGYGLLTVIVALPVLGAAIWLLILLAAMRG